MDVPLGSRVHVKSSTDMDKFPFLIKDDKRDYIGNPRQDSMVIDDVLVDNFERGQFTLDSLRS